MPLRHNVGFLYQPKDFVRSVLQNGVGRYICQLKRLTFVFDKTRAGSSGVRTFIENDLMDFAKDNPGVVVYLMPKRNKAPYIYGEYVNGRNASIFLNYFPREKVSLWVNYLRTRSGLPIVEFEKKWRTDTPSIQGVWTPFLHQPTDMNLRNFPDSEYSAFYATKPTATEQVLKIFKENGGEMAAPQSQDSKK